VARLTAISGIGDLSLTTNGALLAAHAAELRRAGLERINISINSLDRDRFTVVTGSDSLESAREGLDAALVEGFDPVKVNVVMLEGIEDELESYVRLVRDLPVHLRFIECMPVGRGKQDSWSYVPRDPWCRAGPARYFRLRGAVGTIGFISAMSDHFCDSCNRIRLTAEGRLRNCLFSDEEVDIRHLIGGDRDQLREAIIASMSSKKFDLRRVSPGARAMSQLGG
jgi:cyclic pyranopterin phosphate synthase